jgi:DNA-binding transcriptional MerR regulator
MRIGELSRRTGVAPRMLRYYEEQGLLHPERSANGYRSYDTSNVQRVQQVRDLLGSGLTTEIVRTILPFLAGPEEIHLHPDCWTAEMAALLCGEVERIQRRIDCLARNRDALQAYLSVAKKGPSPAPRNRPKAP